MHGLLAPFLSDSFAVLVLHKPGFRGCHGENIIEIGDERDCWNKRKGGGNSSLLVHSGLWDVGRGKTKEQKMSKRKSWAQLIQQQQSRKLMASLSSKGSLLQTMLSTSLSSFFLCTVVRRALCWLLLAWEKNQPGNCAACLCRALNRLALKVVRQLAQVLLVKILRENQAISWPLDRETRPFSKQKVKTVWVCPKPERTRGPKSSALSVH